MRLSAVLLQLGATPETRAVANAVMLSDDDIQVVRCALEDIGGYKVPLTERQMLPVGSVEFLRAALAVAGLPEPENMSYPSELQKYMGREVQAVPAGDLSGTWFIKPLATKTFTGFVLDTASDPSSRSEHDREQYEAFCALCPDTLVWRCPVVEFLSEWRYYVDANLLIGAARYDSAGADSAPSPDLSRVSAAASDLRHKGPCTLDFAVLKDGNTVLVEVNDFWAIGLYGRALTPKVYLDLLKKRWQSLFPPP